MCISKGDGRWSLEVARVQTESACDRCNCLVPTFCQYSGHQPPTARNSRHYRQYSNCLPLLTYIIFNTSPDGEQLSGLGNHLHRKMSLHIHHMTRVLHNQQLILYCITIVILNRNNRPTSNAELITIVRSVLNFFFR